MSDFNDPNKESTAEQTDVDLGEMRLIQACCCMVQGLYCPSFSQCFGCSVKGEFLCFGLDVKACRIVDSTISEENECCILSEQKIVCKKPKTVRCTSTLLLCFAALQKLFFILVKTAPYFFAFETDCFFFLSVTMLTFSTRTCFSFCAVLCY